MPVSTTVVRMAFLDLLTIQGFRSFGPLDSDVQKMKFTTQEMSIRRSKAKRSRTEDGPEQEKETKVWPLTLILVRVL